MKRTGKLLVVLAVLITSSFTLKAKAQAAEAEQLLLNWEKLTQLKGILENMYDGYKTLEKGYNAIRDLSEGNFSLHKTFLDGLLEVSPTVKKYHRVADIIRYQVLIVKESKAARTRFHKNGSLTSDELKYLADVYVRLLQRSVQQLDELALVLTAGELRMSDDERLQTIDRIYAGIKDQYAFLRDFNSQTALLTTQRQREKDQIETSKKLYGY